MLKMSNLHHFTPTIFILLSLSSAYLLVDGRIGTEVLSYNELDVNQNADPFTYIPYKTPDRPLYFIAASSLVRPGQIYRVVVSLLSSKFPINITASLHKQNEEITGAVETINPGDTQLLLMQVPFTARPGDYHLRIEGNVQGASGGSGFSQSTAINFSQRFVSILIETNQYVYNLRQPIRIRAIILNTALKPYTDPVDIELLDSRNIIVKRWLSVYPFQGFVSVKFPLPRDYPRGFWTVRVKALDQIEERKILVERWFTDRFDVSVNVPAFVSSEDRYLEGEITANHTNLYPVTGNLTLKVMVKPPKGYTGSGPSRFVLGAESAFDRLTGYYGHFIVYDVIPIFTGSYHFKYSMGDLQARLSPVPLLGCELEVQAIVGERFIDHIVVGYARTRVINSTIYLRFLEQQPVTFKPGMTFEGHIAVSYQDLVPLGPDRLASAVIEIIPSFSMRNATSITDMGMIPGEDRFRVELDTNGIGRFKMKLPQRLQKFFLKAHYYDGRDEAFTTLTAESVYSPSGRYIQILSSTAVGKAGEYGIFHVYSNFHMPYFDYIVMAKDEVIFHSQKETQGLIKTITTFEISLSPEMAPACKVIVYHITPDGEVIADSIALPIEGINRAPMTFDINRKQDRSGNLIELIPGLTLSTIAGTAAWDVNYVDIQGFNGLTSSDAHLTLNKFDTRSRLKRVVFRNRMGRNQRVDFFRTSNLAQDAQAIFDMSGLLVYTNLKMGIKPTQCPQYYNVSRTGGISSSIAGHPVPHPTKPPQTSWFGRPMDMPRRVYVPCRTGSRCYDLEKRCDGLKDCEDGSDESDCDDLVHEKMLQQEMSTFFLYRRNRNNYFYDATGGDFAWQDTYTGYGDNNYLAVDVPERPVLWSMTAIGVGQSSGLSILEQPYYYDSARPFFMTVEAPAIAVVGEQIGLRIALFNYQRHEIRAEVILEDSLDYQFIRVGEFGRVNHYNPFTSFGELQHLVYIKPHSAKMVYIPIVATTRGRIRVGIVGRTQVARDRQVVPIEMIPEGASVSLHTSLLLDLRNQAYLVKFLDVNVTEDPIIPYRENIRRYLFGSPKASVSIIGDVVGAPSSLEFEAQRGSWTTSSTPSDLLYVVDFTSLKVSRAAKSGELLLFNFAYHLLTLHYLRVTNQLYADSEFPGKQTTSGNSELVRLLLEVLNRDYVNQILYFKDGAFTMFLNDGFKAEKLPGPSDQGSVWLTAYAARIYYMAQYADWDKYIYIDPKIIYSSLEYVLKHQNMDGSFHEANDPQHHHIPLSNRTAYSRPSTNPRLTPIALTAHVLITLAQVKHMPGELSLLVTSGRRGAVDYLERNIHRLTSPYEVAIATYALLQAGSVQAKTGFEKLEEMKTITEGMVYWSSSPFMHQGILYQSQRTFIQPRHPQANQSLAVEATGYALMVYIRYGGLIEDQIVRWLNYMRLHDEGFISTYDTIVALEALIEYSFRTNVRTITNMDIELEVSSNPGDVEKMVINPYNLARKKQYRILPNVWGHVTVSAKGAGLAIVQLNTEFNVDKEFLLLQPPVKAFDLEVVAQYSGRNKSIIDIESCARWALNGAVSQSPLLTPAQRNQYGSRPTSGIAVMELTLPTGYLQYKPVIDQYLQSGQNLRLKQARVLPRSAVFMFDYIGPEWSCVRFRVERWFPVANMTRWLKMKVYDLYEPELYQERILDDVELHLLNVCEVCGSYQCPYCPHYSHASPHIIINLSSAFTLLFLNLFIWWQ